MVAAVQAVSGPGGGGTTDGSMGLLSERVTFSTVVPTSRPHSLHAPYQREGQAGGGVSAARLMHRRHHSRHRPVVAVCVTSHSEVQ